MRKIIFILLLLCCIEPSSAKIKVVESSSKQVPVWYNGTVEEFIISSTISDISLDDAKRRAMDQVKVKVIESVAQNISHTIYSEVIQRSGDVNSFSDEVQSVLLLNSANLPFISGISESKVEESYWSITEDTSTGKRNYIYSLKYPFSHHDARVLVATFKELDETMSERLKHLEQLYESVSSVEEIFESISKCGELERYFFDATRRAAVESLKERFSSLYSQIMIVTQSERLGWARIVLKIGDREVSSAHSPNVKYDRVTIQDLHVTHRNGGLEVSYDPQFCDENLPYIITLNFKIGSRMLSHDITFQKGDDIEIKLQPQGVVALSAQTITSTSLTSVKVSFDLKFEGLPQSTPIVVDDVTMRMPSLRDEFNWSSPSVRYIADGVLKVEGLNDSTISLSGDPSNTLVKLLSGEVIGHYELEGKMTPFRAKFSLPYSCNW